MLDAMREYDESANNLVSDIVADQNSAGSNLEELSLGGSVSPEKNSADQKLVPETSVEEKLADHHLVDHNFADKESL
jgi:hypothetical protein